MSLPMAPISVKARMRLSYLSMKKEKKSADQIMDRHDLACCCYSDTVGSFMPTLIGCCSFTCMLDPCTATTTTTTKRLWSSQAKLSITDNDDYHHHDGARLSGIQNPQSRRRRSCLGHLYLALWYSVRSYFISVSAKSVVRQWENAFSRILDSR